jgi:hypothetical protein
MLKPEIEEAIEMKASSKTEIVLLDWTGCAFCSLGGPHAFPTNHRLSQSFPFPCHCLHLQLGLLGERLEPFATIPQLFLFHPKTQ